MSRSRTRGWRAISTCWAAALPAIPYLFPGTNNMWVNVGKSQFHLPTGDPLVLRGHIGIVTPRPRGAAEPAARGQEAAQGHQVQVQGAQRLRRGDLPVGQQVPHLRAGRGALRQDQSRHPLCRVHRAGRHRQGHRPVLSGDPRRPHQGQSQWRRQGGAHHGRPQAGADLPRDRQEAARNSTATTCRSMSRISAGRTRNCASST